MSGRISDIVIHPKRRATWYVAVGSGGVWKTENAGTTWTPMFDAQGVVLDRLHHARPVEPRDRVGGHGRERQRAPRRLRRRRLQEPERRQDVDEHGAQEVRAHRPDPGRPARLRTSCTSRPRGRSGRRAASAASTSPPTAARPGRSSLEISKDTGVTSAEIDPSNPDILYAAAYQRRRTVAAFMGGGPESAIYKSEDARQDLAQARRSACPRATSGRSASPSRPIDPRVVYATVEAAPDERGFYRSAEQGRELREAQFVTSAAARARTTTRRSSPTRTRFDRVYQMDPGLMVTDDGGKTFVRVPREEQARRQPRDGVRAGRPGLHPERQRRRRVRDARPRRDLAVLREPAGDAVLQAGPRQRPPVLQRARRRAGQRQPDGAVADAQRARHLELRLDDHLRRRRVRHRRRSDRPEHRLSRVAGGQPAPVRPEEPRDGLHQPEARRRAIRRSGSTGTRRSSSARTRTRASTTRRSTCGAATTAATRGRRSARTSRAASSGSSSRSWAARGAPTRCGTTARCRCSRRSRPSASRRWSKGSSTRGPTTA